MCCVREGLLCLVSQRAAEVAVCCVIEGVDACRGLQSRGYPPQSWGERGWFSNLIIPNVITYNQQSKT